jgi:hypothetical protein
MRGLLSIALTALTRAEMKGRAPLCEPIRNFCGNEYAAERITRGLALDQGLRRTTRLPTPKVPTPAPRLTRLGFPERPGNAAQEPAQENESGQNADRQD